MAENQLFATLDPTMRESTRPSNRTIILSDTVGFIRPAARTGQCFSRDPGDIGSRYHEGPACARCSHPGRPAEEDVETVLAELGLAEDALQGRVIEVLNKTDNLDPDTFRSIAIPSEAIQRNANAGSALTGDGVADLLEDRRSPVV